METVRLTAAQAIVEWLVNHHTVVDGELVPIFAGAFGIFGHGNVTCLAEALEPVQDRLPTWRGHKEQSAAATSSIGPGCTNMVTAAAVAHPNRLPLLILSGDTFQHRIVDPVLQQIEVFEDPTVTVCDTFKPVSCYWDRITRPEQVIRSLPPMSTAVGGRSKTVGSNGPSSPELASCHRSTGREGVSHPPPRGR